MQGAGLHLVLGLLLLLGSAGCRDGDQAGADPELEGARALGLPPGARLLRVTLGGRGSEEHAVPLRLEARPGDAVEFVSVDHRVHVVTFPPDSLSPEARSFLESTGQSPSRPLVSRGSRFIILLEGAPPGRYPFLSEGHGGIMGGVIWVVDPSAESAGGAP